MEEKNNKMFVESSIPRILSQNKEHDCAIITAFRQYDKDGKPIDKNTNNRNNILLGKTLRYRGYGITSVIGTYGEQQTGLRPEKENSWFVVNLHDDSKFIDDIINFGIADGQDSVLIIPKNGFFDVKTVYLYGTNDNNVGNDAFVKWKEKKYASAIKFGNDNLMLTKIKNKYFYFRFDNIIDEKEHIFNNFSNAQEMIGRMKMKYKFMFKK